MRKRNIQPLREYGEWFLEFKEMKRIMESWKKFANEKVDKVWYHGSTKDFDDFTTSFRHTFGDFSS